MADDLFLGKYKVYTDPNFKPGEPVEMGYKGIISDWCLMGYYIDGRSSRWWYNSKTSETRVYQGDTEPEDCPVIKRD